MRIFLLRLANGSPVLLGLELKFEQRNRGIRYIFQRFFKIPDFVSATKTLIMKLQSSINTFWKALSLLNMDVTLRNIQDQ